MGKKNLLPVLMLLLFPKAEKNYGLGKFWSGTTQKGLKISTLALVRQKKG